MSETREHVVLVTGASSGIGKSVAYFLAQKGFRVYGTSRKAPSTPEQTPKSTVTMLCMDVTDSDSVEQALAEVLRREGRIDIVINNAGAGLAGPVETTAIEEAQWQMDVNFLGALRVCRAAMRIMRPQQSGYIVNISSIGGVIAIPYQAIYSASKFALEGLTESLRYEASPFGIRVVLVEPGDHKTGFTQSREFTQASASDHAYQLDFERAVGRMIADEQGGPDPEAIGRLIHRIVSTRRPRLRYTVGPSVQRAAVWLRRLLPYRLIELGLRRYYRLRADAPRPPL